MVDRNSSTAELEEAVKAYWVPNPFLDAEQFSGLLIKSLFKLCKEERGGRFPCHEFLVQFCTIAEELYKKNGLHNFGIDFDHHTDPVAHGRYRDDLLYLLELAKYPAEDWDAAFFQLMIGFFWVFLEFFPDFAMVSADEVGEPSASDQFVSVLHAIDENVPELIDTLFAIVEEHPAPPAFMFLRAQLEKNLNREGGVLAGLSELPPADALKRYLADTQLEKLFYVQLPIPIEKEVQEDIVEEEAVEEEAEPKEPDIDERAWYTHCLFLAQSGRGKTNGVRWRIKQLMPQIAAGEASLIVMEPKGVLCREILHLAEIWEMRDRVVVLDPTEESVSVNLFETVDNSVQSINETIGRVCRIFDTVSVPLTTLQKTTLSFAIRVLLSMETPPTLDTLIHVLRHGIADLNVPNLSRSVRNYFEYDFKPNPKSADPRASEIINRINGLLADPVFEQLFGGERSTFDILKAMQAGSLIVIDASKSNEVYGRFWIEEVARTIRPRLALPFHQRTPTSFIIDEAQTWVADDLHFADILDRAREARLGMFAAMHHMAQVTNDQVRHSMYTNMAVKMTANTSADIHNLCRSMGTTDPDFITTLGAYEFAFFGPNMRQAIKVKLPFVDFEHAPHMSREQYQALRMLNRRTYAPGPVEDHSPEPAVDEIADEPSPPEPETPPPPPKPTSEKKPPPPITPTDEPSHDDPY